MGKTAIGTEGMISETSNSGFAARVFLVPDEATNTAQSRWQIGQNVHSDISMTSTVAIRTIVDLS